MEKTENQLMATLMEEHRSRSKDRQVDGKRWSTQIPVVVTWLALACTELLVTNARPMVFTR